MQIDNVDALLLEPVHTALRVHAITDDHLAEAELINQTAAVPARGERGDQDRVVPGWAAPGSAKGVGLSVQRAVALLHQAVVPCSQQRAVDMEDRTAHGNSTLSKANARLFQCDRQHAMRVQSRSNHGFHSGSLTLLYSDWKPPRSSNHFLSNRCPFLCHPERSRGICSSAEVSWKRGISGQLALYCNLRYSYRNRRYT